MHNSVSSVLGLHCQTAYIADRMASFNKDDTEGAVSPYADR